MTYFYDKYLDRYHRQRLFDVSLILQLVGLIIGCSVYKKYPTIMMMLSLAKVASFGLLALKLVIDFWERLFTKRQIIVLPVLTIFICGLAFRNLDQHIAFVWLFILGSHDVELRRIIKLSFWTHVFCLAFIWTSCQCGFIDNLFLDRLYGETEDTIQRYCLGFTYVTTFANLFFYTVLMQVAYRRKYISYIEILIDGGIAYYLFRMSDTKNAFATTLLVLALSLVVKLVYRLQSVAYQLRIALYALFPTCMFVLGFVSIKLNITGGWLAKFNELVTGRLSLTRAAYRQYGIHLFGKPITWIGTDALNPVKGVYNYVDSSYMQQLYSMGIIFMILVMIGVIFLYRKAVLDKDVYLIISLVVMMLHATFDPQFFILTYNIFLLSYGYIQNKEWRYSDEFTFKKTKGV